MNPPAAVTKADVIEAALVGGDLSRLTTEERIEYYRRLCESLGLNPLTKPFAYITLNGKLTLYALKDATEQLRRLRRVSLTLSLPQVLEDVYVIRAQAKDKDGRTDEATGAVPVKGLTGEAKANAMMKAETKAKRRVTLSICGLGMLDETEVEAVPGARPEAEPAPLAGKLDAKREEAVQSPAPKPDPEPATEGQVVLLEREKKRLGFDLYAKAWVKHAPRMATGPGPEDWRVKLEKDLSYAEAEGMLRVLLDLKPPAKEPEVLPPQEPEKPKDPRWADLPKFNDEGKEIKWSACKGPRCGAPIRWGVNDEGRKQAYESDGSDHRRSCPDYEHLRDEARAKREAKAASGAEKV